MKHRPTILQIMLISAFMLTGLLAGCSDDAASPTAGTAAADDYAKLDFSTPYGGLTASDEAEAFGDDALLAMSLAEVGEEVADPVADDPAVREMERLGREALDPNDPRLASRPKFTFVHLRWGMLRDMMDSVSVEPPCDVTDWTGSLSVDRGMLVAKRAIRFERPLDHIILPRLNPQTLGLVSHTACGFDGLVLQILERPTSPADSSSVELAPNILHINLGEFSLDVPVAELIDMEEVYEVGDLGNKVALTGFMLRDLEVCPKGFLSGHYRELSADRPDSSATDRPGEQYGVFAGMWRGLDGRIMGHLRGGYGVDESGNRVFVGKYIGQRGRFMGLIRGTWEPGSADGELAGFQGEWVSRDGEVEGLLGGEAFAVSGTSGGFFTGRWATTCAEDATESMR